MKGYYNFGAKKNSGISPRECKLWIFENPCASRVDFQYVYAYRVYEQFRMVDTIPVIPS